GRVEETESHVVLARLVVFEGGPLDPAPEAVRVEHARQPPRALREATVGEASRRGDDRLAVGVGLGEGLEDEREVHASTEARTRGAAQGLGRAFDTFVPRTLVATAPHPPSEVSHAI